MQRFLKNNNVLNKDLSSWDVRNIRSNPRDFAPNLTANGGIKPCWGLNGRSSSNLIPSLNSYSPNNFDNANDSDLDLVLNFDMAVDVVNKKSNLILYRVNGNKTKRVAVYNLHTNKENYFSDGDTKITINICLLYTSPSPRDRTRSRMPSSA